MREQKKNFKRIILDKKLKCKINNNTADQFLKTFLIKKLGRNFFIFIYIIENIIFETVDKKLFF